MKKLTGFIKYTGKMHLETGTSIKGSDNDLSIGGADSIVVKNPITAIPYIPGSSLKGKLRSLLELHYGKYTEKKYEKNGTEITIGSPCTCGKESCFVCKIFGAHNHPGAESAPTRIIVRDCNLSNKSKDTIANLLLNGKNYLEVKAENNIDRASGKVGSPRFIERVPAGLDFNVEIVLQVFEGDDAEDMKAKIKEGLTLLENSYIGSSGSRGYGQVTFNGKWSDEEEAKDKGVKDAVSG